MVGLPKASTYQQKVTIHTGNGNSINVPANKVHTQSMSVKSDGSVFVNDGRAYRPRYTALTKPDYSHIRARNSDGWDLRYQNQIKNMFGSSGRTQSKGMSTFEKAMLITAGIGTLATAGIGIGKAISSLSDFGGFNSDGKGGLGGSEILKALEMANDEKSLTAALADAEAMLEKDTSDTAISAQEAKIKTCQDEVDKQENLLTAKNKEIEDKNREIAEKESESSKIQAEIPRSNTNISTLQDKIKELESERTIASNAKQDTSKIDKEISEKKDLLEKIKSLVDLENNISELKTELKTKKGEKSDIEKAKTEAINDLNKEKNELEKLNDIKNNKTQIEGNIKKYKKKLEKMKKKNDKK